MEQELRDRGFVKNQETNRWEKTTVEEIKTAQYGKVGDEIIKPAPVVR